jgi:hypothetical protein
MFESVHLGDVVCLPDGRCLTARAKVELPMVLGSMAGFIICGEMEALLSTPPPSSRTAHLYHPVHTLPREARQARAVFSGACSYWAPHLPAKRQAMGELLYKVAEVPGTVDPLVIVWRGPEAVMFVRAESFSVDGLSVLYMPRDNEDTAAVSWRSSRVRQSELVPDAVPVSVPASAPAAVPAPSRTL